MADNRNTNNTHDNTAYKMQTQIKCIQINLQNSRVATNNLVKIIEEDGTDILCILEPYIIQNKVDGIQKIQNFRIRGRKKPGSYSSHQQTSRHFTNKTTVG
jgi:Holliday junction resolvasome RuvABC ATP-dependent DNA helicase subunit